MIGASNGWCVAFDNVSALPPRLADALCRLSTGSGFSTRELYTDEEEKLFTATRPILLNGIDGLVVRSDLQDRSIITYLPNIAEEGRQTEQAFWQNFERRRAHILGALLDGVSTALRRLPHVRIKNLPRMADFATWASAARVSFGLAQGQVLAAYARNRECSNSVVLEASPLVPAIKKLMSEKEGRWSGTATELLKALMSIGMADLTMIVGAAKTPGYLSVQIRRLAPNLRSARTGARRIPSSGLRARSPKNSSRLACRGRRFCRRVATHTTILERSDGCVGASLASAPIEERRTAVTTERL